MTHYIIVFAAGLALGLLLCFIAYWRVSDYSTCPEKGCGTRILISLYATQITCPKCHTVYARKL